jgi:hypothetical protein
LPWAQSVSAQYFASAAAQSSTAPACSSLDKSLLDHELTGRGVITFNEPACFEHGPQVCEHRRAAAQHDAIGREIERREEQSSNNTRVSGR